MKIKIYIYICLTKDTQNAVVTSLRRAIGGRKREKHGGTFKDQKEMRTNRQNKLLEDILDIH